jgi:arginyl-tRNA synthetase
MNDKVRSEVSHEVSKAVGIPKGVVEGLLASPPDQRFGDISFPCFSLAKELRRDPKSVAKEIASQVKPKGLISEARQAGPYVNFFLDWGKLGQEAVSSVIKGGKRYGSSGVGARKVVLVEFPGPNTNKPLHLGHMRNMALGESVSRIFGAAGHSVKRVNINNDRGVHICKSMLAYQKWGKGKTPKAAKKKPDHFVGDFYVMYSKKETPSLEKEVKEMLRRWEAGDKKLIALWKRMNKWAFSGFSETYRKFGVKHDREYFESETYRGGKKMVMDGLKKGLFQKDSTGAVIFDLEKHGLGKKVLMRSDGTAVYMTQDIYLAKKRHDDFRFSRMVYVVGNEQDYHFQVLFKVLDAMGMKFAEDCYHLSHGMVNLPSGKMKSREGTKVDADDLIAEMEGLARKEVLSRGKVPKAELERRASQIALGAIKYYLIKNDAVKNMMFSPEESISFEGNTGPYIQYSHARICSMLRKDGKPKAAQFKAALLREPEEKALMRSLLELPKVVQDAARDCRPHYIANYAYRLASEFNNFYERHRVLQAGPELKKARLALIRAVKIALSNALGLMGMDAPEKM